MRMNNAMDKRIKDVVERILARKEDKTVAEKFAAAVAVLIPGVVGSEAGMIPLSVTVFPLPSTAGRNILSRWPWVDKDTVDLVGNG